MRPTLFIICGLPASGKTTFAKNLQKTEKAALLSEDDFMEALFKSYYGSENRDNVAALQRDLAGKILSAGASVVMDAGFWGKDERDKMREIATSSNADFKLYYLKAPLEILIARSQIRNTSLSPEFQTKKEDLEAAYLEFIIKHEPKEGEEDFILITQS